MQDGLEIRGLKLVCSIGVYDWEKQVPQEVFVDMDLPLDIERAAASDELEDTLDYSRLLDCLKAVTDAGHIHLVETLAVRLADAVLKEFGLAQVRLCVDKPAAIAEAESVRICVSRSS